MTQVSDSRKKIAVFLLLTGAISSVLYYLIITGGGIDGAGGAYTQYLMWAPGASALITRLIFQRNLRGFGWKPRNFGAHALAYAFPLLYGAVIYGLVWLAGLGGLNRDTLDMVAGQLGLQGQPAVALIAVYLAVAGTVSFIIGALPGALGEELGWRGLLVPELAKTTSFTRTSLISGLIWVVYHAPVIIWSDYGSGAPTWYVLTMFAVTVTSMSFLYTWLRLRSGSVWTAVLLHASHNMFILGFFDLLMVDTGVTNYLTTEFGAGITVVSLLTAVICWRRRHMVEAVNTNAGEASLAAGPAVVPAGD